MRAGEEMKPLDPVRVSNIKEAILALVAPEKRYSVELEINRTINKKLSDSRNAKRERETLSDDGLVVLD